MYAFVFSVCNIKYPWMECCVILTTLFTVRRCEHGRASSSIGGQGFGIRTFPAGFRGSCLRIGLAELQCESTNGGNGIQFETFPRQIATGIKAGCRQGPCGEHEHCQDNPSSSSSITRRTWRRGVHSILHMSAFRKTGQGSCGSTEPPAFQKRGVSTCGRGSGGVHVTRLGLRFDITSGKGAQTCNYAEEESTCERTRKGARKGEGSGRRQRGSARIRHDIDRPSCKEGK